jgi:hypothetical protein
MPYQQLENLFSYQILSPQSRTENLFRNPHFNKKIKRFFLKKRAVTMETQFINLNKETIINSNKL